ncbi:dihydrofolate reductase family protein [Caldivirga sp.]|uniref:dihydrofolate reductase family protein n=1 Tax=Caldivirga sp. TaxID=2080243 RepID=UPI0025BBBCFA|nr:dihydrofolate reductase family protein [Caldivirga sp.]
MNVKPYVIAIASITMDGKIANPYVRSRFTCRYDLERLFKARDEVDATIVGAQTVIDVDGTYTPKTGKQILRVLIDGAFRVPLESKFLSSPAPVLIAVTERAPRAKIELARKAGMEVMEFDKQVDVEVLLGKLAERGIKKVLVEGGGVVYWQFFTKNLIDEVRLTIAPFMLGKGTSFLEGDSLKIEQSPRFKPVKWYLCECGKEVVIHYTRE